MKKRLLKSLSCIVIIFCVIFLNTGFSAFSASMDISMVSAIIKAQRQISVTGITLGSLSGGANSTYEAHSSNGITSNISLPTSNSQVTYNIVITNLGNVEMGLLNVTGIYYRWNYRNYNI